jgi:alkylation response protein AidB-like acyl-CoA dehydrogenase
MAVQLLDLPAASSPLDRARALLPYLADRCAESERLRRLSPESFAAIRDAGLFRVFVPKRYGGLELDPIEAFDVYAEIGRADGAASWVNMILATCSWLACQFPNIAQDDLFGRNPDACVGGVVAIGRGKAEVVEGGYRLTGFWPFCSGCHYADWVILSGTVRGETVDASEERLFLVPTGEFQIKDDWRTTSLAGSGSNSVTTKDVFVPTHRSMPVALMGRENTLSTSTLYKANFICLFAYVLLAPALGMARAAIDHFVARAHKRPITYTFYDDQAHAPITHIRLGEAIVKIDAAAALARQDLCGLLRDAADAHELTPLEKSELRGHAGYGSRLCLEAAESMFLASGGSAISESNPLQRIARDIHAANMHGIMYLDTNLETLGRVKCGLEPNTPF